MAGAEYTKYLKSEHWQRFRLKALKHHGKQCMMCGIKKVPFFHVHHLTYKNFGHEEFADVVVLCEICHNEVHKTGFVIKPQVKKAEKQNFIDHRNWSKRKNSGKYTAAICHKRKKKKRPVSPVITYKLTEEELKKYRENQT